MMAAAAVAAVAEEPVAATRPLLVMAAVAVAAEASPSKERLNGCRTPRLLVFFEVTCLTGKDASVAPLLRTPIYNYSTKSVLLYQVAHS